MLYEFSISSQLAGALILLIWSFKKVSRNALKMCFPGVTVIEVDDKGNGIIKKEKIRENVKTIFLNVWAFICILLGYLTSIFAQNDMQELWKKLVIVVIVTILLVLVGVAVSTYMSKAWGQKDYTLSSNELEKYDLLTEMTKEDVEKMFPN